MAVDVGKMRKKQDEYNRKSVFASIKAGDTVYYVHPPCRDDDKDPDSSGMPFLRLRVHYGVGANNAMVPCLDQRKNPILKHPFVREALKELGINITGGCPVCAEINKSTIDTELADRMRPQFKFLFGLTPVQFREDTSKKYGRAETEPGAVMTGKTVYEGLMELFYDNGDITDPDRVLFARIRKTGKDLATRYKVDPDIATLKKPGKLPAGFVSKIQDALKNQCDLFKIIASMIREPADIAAMFVGVPLEEETLDDMDDGWGDPAAVDEKQKEDLDEVFGGDFEEQAPVQEDSMAMTDEDEATLAMLDEAINELTD